MKTCCDCKQEKSLSDFSKVSRNKDGLAYRCRECQANRWENIKERYKESRKIHYTKNIERIREEKRQYHKNHKKEKSEYDKIYRRENKEKIARHKKNWEKKNKDNIVHKIKRNLRRRVCHVVRDGYKSDSTMKLLGCTIEYFLDYIQTKFEEGMNWDNYGRYGWHIDHIIPCDAFDLTKEEEQRKCFHYTNLQPLWWQDNLHKAYKVNR